MQIFTYPRKWSQCVITGTAYQKFSLREPQALAAKLVTDRKVPTLVKSASQEASLSPSLPPRSGCSSTQRNGHSSLGEIDLPNAKESTSTLYGYRYTCNAKRQRSGCIILENGLVTLYHRAIRSGLHTHLWWIWSRPANCRILVARAVEFASESANFACVGSVAGIFRCFLSLSVSSFRACHTKRYLRGGPTWMWHV